GLPAALTYDLTTQPPPVPGDVLLLESGLASQGAAPSSDIIRFNAPGFLVFYSDNSDGDNALADTGFPTGRYDNPVILTEDGPERGPNGIVYIPQSGQPGFVQGNNTTYIIHSDLSAVPEPSTLLLAGIGATIGAGCWWRRRKAGATA